MSTTLGFKNLLDVPAWQPMSPAFANTAAGSCLVEDLRNDASSYPYIFQVLNATTLNLYNPLNDEWLPLASPAMGTWAAGSNAVFVPSAGPNGTLAAGATTTSVVINTAFPAAVGVNQLANKGDGLGFRIRIIGNSAGGSGKTEERYITANTGGTQPTITLDSALSFTPASGDRYELLSGRLFIMATAASIWKYYDVATNSMSAALTVTNLTTPATENTLIALDELYVPMGKSPGQGFFGEMTATDTGATSITGTSSAADASQVTSEWVNFQIRITEDTGTPTAVGQRRKITASTNANPIVYTVAAWGVEPSNTAKYVVEGIGDIICWTGAAALQHTYAAGGFRADGAWSTGVTAGAASCQFAARAANTAAGETGVWAFGMESLDAQKNARYSQVFHVRGGASTIDVFDIASNTWSNAIVYGNSATSFAGGTCGAYIYATHGGCYWYLNQSGTQRYYRFCLKSRVLEPATYLPVAQGAALVGEKLCTALFIDGSTKVMFVYQISNTQTILYRLLVQR